MPGFSQKTTNNLESLTKLLNPIAVVSNYAKTCDIPKLTNILCDLRNQLDPETMEKIDEAWDRARVLVENEQIDVPFDEHGQV